MACLKLCWEKKFLGGVRRYKWGTGVKAIWTVSKLELLFFPRGFPNRDNITVVPVDSVTKITVLLYFYIVL